MGIPTTEVEEEAEEEVEEEERQWIGMKGLLTGIQPEGLGEVMLKKTLEGEMAKVHSIEIKGITRLESGQILQVKGEGGMILICIPLQPKADTREIYPLQHLTHQKIDSLQIGLVMGWDLHMKGHLYRMF